MEPFGKEEILIKTFKTAILKRLEVLKTFNLDKGAQLLIDSVPEALERKQNSFDLAVLLMMLNDVGKISSTRNERYYPGYLVKHCETGQLAIVRGDYEYIHQNGHERQNKFNSLELALLNKSGEIYNITAWQPRSRWEIIDRDHVKENIIKIAECKFHN